jgi:hypothetical protein
MNFLKIQIQCVEQLEINPILDQTPELDPILCYYTEQKLILGGLRQRTTETDDKLLIYDETRYIELRPYIGFFNPGGTQDIYNFFHCSTFDKVNFLLNLYNYLCLSGVLLDPVVLKNLEDNMPKYKKPSDIYKYIEINTKRKKYRKHLFTKFSFQILELIQAVIPKHLNQKDKMLEIINESRKIIKEVEQKKRININISIRHRSQSVPISMSTLDIQNN